MSCPSCGHTMHNLGVEPPGGRRVFWCPRCGTVKRDSGPNNFETVSIPKLVSRVKSAVEMSRTCWCEPAKIPRMAVRQCDLIESAEAAGVKLP